ncbi:hypothetical protein PoB_003103500 [Plakobranchus ocellatus]|uniref:Uncharacterized protein n=1 Tax=Plakobranchus ocellatus TaxID=259542 RepID=A0AAV4ACI7_9GAST|nr:hypothetical protein PoB_003103500 [Plakobranchus ocellatus]
MGAGESFWAFSPWAGQKGQRKRACSSRNFGKVLMLAAWFPLQSTQWRSAEVTFDMTTLAISNTQRQVSYTVAIALALIAAQRERLTSSVRYPACILLGGFGRSKVRTKVSV